MKKHANKRINDKIIVEVKPGYIADQSDPENQRFIWAYEVNITNDSKEIVQLLNRHFQIVDMNGNVEDIQGIGVIGMQPLIKPGKTFSYTSFCQLTTPQGTMEGDYEFQNLEDEKFLATIPKFILTAPASITKLFRSKLH